MPNSVDNRIVEMQFDNANFEKNIKQSINSLEKLDKALEMNDAGKGFEKMEEAASRVDLSKLEKAADIIEHRFSAAGIAGAAAISRAVNGAINLVGKLGSSVINLAKTGGIRRALNLEHANFMLNGLIKDAEKVAKIMDGPVNNAVSGTAYGLDAAAKAAAQFVASGVTDMEKLENALTGISGVAAMTGATYEEISEIFTAVSGKGKAMTMDLNRINQRGVNAAAAIAKYLHKTEAEVSEMARKSQISFEIFSEAMNDAFGEQAKKANETFNGAMSNVKAALSRIGAKIATPALESLRKVFVSLIEVVNNLNKALSKGIIPKIVNLIKQFGYMAPLTLKSKRVMDLMSKSVEILDKAFSNFLLVVDVVKTAFRNIFPGDIFDKMKAINAGFEKIVDALDISGEKAAYLQITLEGLFSILDIILTLASQVIDIILPGFSTIFGATDDFGTKILKVTAVISTFIGYLRDWLKQNNIIKAAVELLVGAVGLLASKIADVGSKLHSMGIGTLLQTIATAFVAIGGAIVEFISQVSRLPVVQRIINDLKYAIIQLGTLGAPIIAFLADAFLSLIDSMEKFASGGYMTRGLERLNDVLNGLYWGASNVKGAIGSFFGIFSKNKSVIEKIDDMATSVEKVSGSLSEFNDTTAQVSSTVVKFEDNFSNVAGNAARTMTETRKEIDQTSNSLDKAGKVFLLGFGASVISAGVNIGRMFGQLAGTIRNIKGTSKAIRMFFDQLQLNLRIKTLLSLATAIAVLAGSLALMTLLDPVKLIASATALSILVFIMSQLAKTLSTTNPLSVMNFASAASGLVQFAGALLILAAAAKVMVSVGASDIVSLLKGVGAVVVMMYALAGAIILLGNKQEKAIQGATSMIAFGASIYLIMKALQKVQTLDLDKIKAALPLMLEIMGGLVAVAFATGAIISPFGGVSFIGVVAGILMLFEGLTAIGKLDYKVLAQVEQVIDYIVLAIQHIMVGLIVLQALKTAEQLFMWLTARWMGVVKSLKNMFNIAQKGLKYIGVAAIIISIAAAIKIIGDTLIGLSALDTTQIIKGTALVVALAAGVLTICNMLSDMMATVFSFGATGMQVAMAMGGLATAIIAISLSIKLLADMDPELFARGAMRAAAISALVLGIIAVLGQLQAVENNFTPALRACAGIALLIGTLVASVAILSIIPWQEYIPAVASMVVLVATLGLVLLAVSKMSAMTVPATVAVFGLAAVFASLGGVMYLLKDLVTANVAANGLVLLGMVAGMALIMKAIVTMAPDVTIAEGVLFAITGVFTVLTICAAILSAVDPANFLLNVGIMTAAVVALGVLMVAFGAIVNGGGATIVGAGILVLESLAIVMLKVSAAAVLFSAASILTSVGLNGISDALAKMKDIDIVSIAGGLALLAGSSILLGAAAMPLVSFSMALLIALPTLLIFSSAVEKFVSGISLLQNIDLSGVLAELIRLGEAAQFVVDRFGLFMGFAVIANTVGIACTALGVGLASVSVGLLGIGLAIDVAIAGFDLLALGIKSLATIIISITDHLNTMVSTIKSLGAETVSSIYDALITFASTQLPTAGATMMIYIQEGFSEQIPTSVKQIIDDIVEGFEGELGRQESALYRAGQMASTPFLEGMKEVLGAYCEAQASVDAVKDVVEGFQGETARSEGTLNATGQAVGNAYGGGIWNSLKGWLSSIRDKIKEFMADPVGWISGGVEKAVGDATGKANSLISSYNRNKIYGRSLDFDSGLKNGTWVYIGNGQYMNTKTGDQKDLIKGTSSTLKDVIDAETEALNANSKATGGSSKAKKENEKANEAKTEAIDEETGVLEEETTAAEDNREEILALAEAIEIITKEFDKSFNHLRTRDNFKIVKNLTSAFSTFWSKGFGENGWKKASQITKAFKQVNKTIKGTTKVVKKGAYAFEDTGKYAGKLSKKLSKSTKTIEEQVMKTGKNVIKVTEGQAVAFSKVGNTVQRTTMRVSKNVKKLGQYFNDVRDFTKEMNGINPYQFVMNTKDAYGFINKYRAIEKYFVKLGDMPQKIQDIMTRVNEKMEPFSNSLNTLGRRIDGVGNYMKKSSTATAYVQDAFVSLAATLYDGSDAANEYETEHAKLLFLFEHGEATIEEVEEHFRSYISRIMEALEEYRNSIEENLRGSLDIWSEFDKKIDDSNKNFLDTIESQIAGYNQWADMLFELSKRGMDMNILKMLTDEGVSSYGKLKSLLGMTANQIALFNQRYAESEAAITKARDTSLAALANATVRASQRAAAESSKTAKTQMKQSKTVAKRLIDDARAVAENQARYRSLTKQEEEKYLASLTAGEKEFYQKRLKEVRKAMKAEQKMAKKEETKRAREKKVSSILSEVKSFEKLRKQYHKYLGDAKMLKEINNQVAKSLENVSKKIKKFDGRSVKQMRYSWLAFAETLDATGNEANDYLTEMSERLENFVNEIENATKAGEEMFKTFEKGEKINVSSLFTGITSQTKARQDIGSLFDKVIKMGFSQEAIKYLYSMKDNMSEFYTTLESFASMTTDQVALTNKSISTLNLTTDQLNSLLENGFANTSTAAAKIAVEDAQKSLDKNKSTLKSVTKENKKIIDAANQTKAALQKELQNAERQIAMYQAQLSSKGLSKNDRKTVQNNISNLEKTIASIRTKYNDADNKLAQAQTAINKAQNEVNKAQANLDKNKQQLAEENNMAAKQYVLNDAKKALSTAESEYKSVKKTVAAENKSFEQQIAKLTNELNDTEAKYTSTKNKATKKTLKTKMDEIKKSISALQTQSKKNTENVTKAEEKYKKALDKVNAATAEYNKVRDEQNNRAKVEEAIQNALNSIDSYKRLKKVLVEYAGNAEVVKRANAGLANSMSGINGAVDEFGKRWRSINNLSTKTSTAAFKEIAGGFLNLADAIADTNEEFDTFDDYIAARTQALSNYRDTLYDTIKGQVNLFDEFKRYSGEKPTSAGTYLDNMQSQLSGLEAWLTNLETLAKRGVNADLIAMFANEGQNSFEKVAAFASATEDEIIELVGQYSRYQSLLDVAADRAMATVGYAYTDTAIEFTNSIVAAFKGIDTSRIQEEAYETGVMIINGVKDGLGHVMPELMADIADTAEEAAAKKAGAAIGKAINDGIVKAVSDNVQSTVNAAIERFKMAVDTVNSYVQNNLQSDYTITIHVNTSEIDAAVARMNAAINGINANAGVTQQAVATSQANQAALTPTALGAEAPVNNVTLNYTQNNTSPVALSRTEIYRQTQNQLSTINGAISAAMG